MIGTDFVPDDNETKKSVRKSLHLSTRIPEQKNDTLSHITIDFHQHTEEQAWEMFSDAIKSGSKNITVITGASGVLKIKFQQWVSESVLSQYIISCTALNNGSFRIKNRYKKSCLDL